MIVVPETLASVTESESLVVNKVPVVGDGAELLDPPPPPQELISNMQTVARKHMAHIPFDLTADARRLCRDSILPPPFVRKV